MNNVFLPDWLCQCSRRGWWFLLIELKWSLRLIKSTGTAVWLRLGGPLHIRAHREHCIAEKKEKHSFETCFIWTSQPWTRRGECIFSSLSPVKSSIFLYHVIMPECIKTSCTTWRQGFSFFIVGHSSQKPASVPIRRNNICLFRYQDNRIGLKNSLSPLSQTQNMSSILTTIAWQGWICSFNPLTGTTGD